MKFATRFGAALLSTGFMTLITLSLAGCGDGYAARHKVSGNVNYNGAPVAKGNIVFHPVDIAKDGARQANAQILNGKYTLTTFTNNDGALPGEYNVTVSSRDVGEIASNKGGSAKQDDVAKANKIAKKLVPSKYELPDTTPLKSVKIPGGKYDFDLTD